MQRLLKRKRGFSSDEFGKCLPGTEFKSFKICTGWTEQVGQSFMSKFFSRSLSSIFVETSISIPVKSNVPIAQKLILERNTFSVFINSSSC